MIIVKCDRCGAEIAKEAPKYRVEIIANRDANVEEIINDLCDHCREELHRFLSLADYYWDTHDPSGGDLPLEDDENDEKSVGGYKVDPRKDESSGTAAGQRQKRAVNVDHGKICALRKAGWSVKEICAEMHVSPATVFNHLKTEKDNEEKQGM